MPSSKASSWPRDPTHISYVSCIDRQVFPTELPVGLSKYKSCCLMKCSHDSSQVCSGLHFTHQHFMSFNGMNFPPLMAMETLWVGQERSPCKQVNRDRCEFCLITGTWRNKYTISWAWRRTSVTRPLAFIKHRSQLTFTEIRLFPVNLKDIIYPGGALPGKGSSICIHGNLCGGLHKDGTFQITNYCHRLQTRCHTSCHPMMTLCDHHKGNL